MRYDVFIDEDVIAINLMWCGISKKKNEWNSSDPTDCYRINYRSLKIRDECIALSTLRSWLEF